MRITAPVSNIPFSECHSWEYQDFELLHHTKQYFSIVCFAYDERERIMINQPEIGILGFILTKNSLTRKWLLQNKPEPGNTDFYQLAPSVQATKSNYQRAHGGEKTQYLEYFIENNNTIINIQQSEQGSKFVNKFNLNSKCFIDNEFAIENPKSFIWLSSEALKTKLQKSFLVNTDARSVLTAGRWYLLSRARESAFKQSSLLSAELSNSFNKSYLFVENMRLNKAESILTFINKSYCLKYEIIKFQDMKYHYILDEGIYNNEHQTVVSYFDVNFLEREVKKWQQPLLLQEKLEHCVLFFTIDNNIAYFYVQAYPEVGFHNRVEFGPSLQTGDDIFKTTSKEVSTLIKNSEVLLQIDQSDEGGRFFQNITQYTLAMITNKEDKNELTKENGIWLSLGELEVLSSSKGKLTNELRTTLSLLLSYI